MSKAKISLAGVSKSYISENEVTQALHKINLDFYFGEFVAITGESGGGKSTLLNVIGGMTGYDDGEMYVDGEPTFQYDDADWEEYRRRKVGYIFQDYSLIGHYTVIDNIVSGLFAMGKSKEEAESLAMTYIEKVGLKGYETHPANELSSGQKQRLSIARALAKQTGVILADEPTGNLDSETGLSIVKLLKEISKECLVIMVTHNYAQAEPYVTRKIRLHEGVIISDIRVSENEENESGEKAGTADTDKVVSGSDSTEKHGKKETAGSDGAAKYTDTWYAKFFVKLNLKTQRAKAMLFTLFLIVISAVSFVLIGELNLKSDDICTKNYDGLAFARQSDKRISVKKKNGKKITADDIKQIKKIRYIENVDSCDYADDINYYIIEDRDYEMQYGMQITQRDIKGSATPSFLKDDKFMLSTDCITKDDLKKGELPQKMDEVVMYSDDENLIGKEMVCYFSCYNIWDGDDYIKRTVKVTGLLKKKTSQVYFTKELCNMMTMNLDSSEFRLLYDYDVSMEDYKAKRKFVPVINESLTGNQVMVSQDLISANEAPGAGKYTLRIQKLDEDGKADGDCIDTEVELLSKGNGNTGNFLEVSREFFNKYYSPKYLQASVYIANYAKTDYVLKKLEKSGYYAVSTYRAGATSKSDTKEQQRLVIIGICTAGLVVMFIAGFLILRAMMSLNVKEYIVFRFIGMKKGVLRRINYIELAIYCVIAMVVALVLAFILRLAGVGFITDITWYYRFGTYICFVLYNIFLCAVTAMGFNHYVKRRFHQ